MVLAWSDIVPRMDRETSRSVQPLHPAPCSRCGYQLEGVHITTADDSGVTTGVAQWRAVCPECGHDNFGPPHRGRSWAQLPLVVRLVLLVALLGVTLTAAAMLLHFW